MSVAEKSEKKSGGLGETFSVIIQALLLALVIRTLLFQPFSIPSGSMRPTLLEGDYLFVTKWAYGYSRYSLPFGPNLFSGRIWGSEPKRGDVVVFKFPPDPSVDYIKRVVGLPGDKIYITVARHNSTNCETAGSPDSVGFSGVPTLSFAAAMPRHFSSNRSQQGKGRDEPHANAVANGRAVPAHRPFRHAVCQPNCRRWRSRRAHHSELPRIRR